METLAPDILGEPYQRLTFDLGSDREGPVSATLVRRLADPPHHSRAAVLYLHGYVDYFFQTHLADFYVDLGIDFYALDLRRHGRSLAAHQTPNDCRDLSEYYPEIDSAVKLIRDAVAHRYLLVNGHSTGGLLAALWAHDRRDAGLVDALFLNSPFLDLNAPWVMRRPLATAVAGLGALLPATVIPFVFTDVHGRSIHHEHHGVWHYDLAWKPLRGFGVRAGWLRAVRTGQRRVHAGLDIQVPILVATSAASYRGRRWSEAARGADSVLDVDHMARWAPALGRQVTLVRVEGGLHDLVLSAQPARGMLFREVTRWLNAQRVPTVAGVDGLSSPGGRSGRPSAVPTPAPAGPSGEG